LELSEEPIKKTDREAHGEIRLSLMQAAFQTERNAITELHGLRAIDRETFHRLIREVDASEIAQNGHATSN
jgi:hypothetical protein